MNVMPSKEPSFLPKHGIIDVEGLYPRVTSEFNKVLVHKLGLISQNKTEEDYLKIDIPS